MRLGPIGTGAPLPLATGLRRGSGCPAAGALAVREHTRRAVLHCARWQRPSFWLCVLQRVNDAVCRLGCDRPRPKQHIEGTSEGRDVECSGHSKGQG